MCLGVASTVALFSALQDGPLEEFLFEPRSLDRYTASVERSTTMMEPPASVQFGIGQRQVRIGVSVWPAVRLNRERIGLERDLRMRSRLLSEAEPHVQQRFLEWQAALNTVEQSPLVGVGPGRYQEQVGYHFYELPKLNTLEPGAQNGFLVILVTSGFLGLSAFSWILLHLVSLLRELANGGPELRDRGPAERGLDLGLGVALASFVLVNIFYDASSQHATTMLFVVVAALVTLRHAQDRPVRELVFDGEPPAHPSRTHSSAMADRVSPTEATSSLSLDQRGRNGEEGSIPTPC
jgi:hypothetical protein